MKKLALLNTAILTTEGLYKISDISLSDARLIVWENSDNLDSAIGHESTAKIMSELLDIEIPMNRQNFQQMSGQKAIVFKLNGRPEEGKILSKEDIEEIGYKFQLLERRE